MLQFALEELQQLYQLLEQEYDPLSLCSRVTPILTSLEDNESLKQYVDPLKEIMIIRLIKEVT